MEKFCIITNNEKDKDYKISNRIRDYLIERGKSCIIAKESTLHIEEYDSYTDISVIDDEVECAIVLGGDGTLIQTANDLVYKDIPLLGVNLGTLGFLTEVEQDNIIPALERLFQGKCNIERRMMLEGTIVVQGSKGYYGHALNDIVITKRGLCRVITVNLYINEELIDTYLCDGVIVSTPTGSTGYNLSAGGPVVAPGLKGMLITAICPHSLNNRCIMVSANDQVILELGRSKEAKQDEAAAIYDGRITSLLTSGDQIVIERAKEETKLVKVTDTSFFQILRSKIGKGRIY